MAQWKLYPLSARVNAHSTHFLDCGGCVSCCQGIGITIVRQLYLWLCTALPNQIVVWVLHMMQGTTTWVKSIHCRGMRERGRDQDREREINFISSLVPADVSMYGPGRIHLSCKPSKCWTVFFFCSLITVFNGASTYSQKQRSDWVTPTIHNKSITKFVCKVLPNFLVNASFKLVTYKIGLRHWNVINVLASKDFSSV